MKKTFILFSCFIFLTIPTISSAQTKSSSATEAYVDQMLAQEDYDASRVLVKYKETDMVKNVNRKGEAISQLWRSRNLDYVYVDGFISVYEGFDSNIEVPHKIASTDSEKKSVRESLIELNNDPNVEYAEPNYIKETHAWTIGSGRAIPSGYSTNTHWYYEAANLPELWFNQECEIGTLCGGGQDVVVAVVDTGVAFEAYDDLGEDSFSDRLYDDNVTFYPGTTGQNIGRDGGINYTAVSPNLTSYNLYVNPGEIPNNGLDDDCNALVDDYNGVDMFALNYFFPFEKCIDGVPNDYSDSSTKFLWKEGHPVDTQGHGTYVTGLITGHIDINSTPSPAFNVKLMPIAANMHSKKTFFNDHVMDGVAYAFFYNADVVNLSLGGGGYSLAEEELFEEAFNEGTIVIASSGNDSSSNSMQQVSYPAAYESVIAVGSVDADGGRSFYSNGGSEIDLVAYVGGGNSAGNATYQTTLDCFPCTISDDIDSTSATYSIGTSFAAPQVTAAVAFIKSKNPTMTPIEVKNHLIASVNDLGTPGWDEETGYGAIDYDALWANIWSTWDSKGATQGNVSMTGFDGRLYQSVRGSSNNNIYTRSTVDGTLWSAWDSDGATGGEIAMVEFNGNLYQAVKGNTSSTIYTRYTSDGTNWSEWIGNGSTGSSISMIEFNGNLYQAVRGSSSSTIYTRYTSDGTNWSNWSGNGATGGEISMVEFNSKLYQAVRGSSSNTIYTRYTNDGTNWSNWSGNGATRGEVTMTTFSGDLYQAVRGNSSNTIYTRYTSDGTNWSNWSGNGATQGAISMVEHDGRLFQSVRGNSNDNIYTRFTYNGINWNSWVPSGATTGKVSLVVYDGSLFQSARSTTGNGIITRFTIQ